MLDLNKIKTYSLRQRYSKVKVLDFAKVGKKGERFKEFYASLPNILAAKDFKQIVDAIVSACKRKKPVILMLGAHPIKCGLSPLIIQLINKGIIKHVAMNGAGIIHDFELSLQGKTSEDVGASLKSGKFGMAKETAEFLNSAINDFADLGIGEAVAKAIAAAKLRYKNLSILYACEKKGIPVTVHIAIGTDIIHQHPSCDGASLGEAALIDFHKFTETVAKLGNGGVVLNVGSAVIMPEVFLKALNIARNLRHKVNNFTTANFDMLHHYRPQQNVVSRPTQNSGRGFYIIGHHEIMLPLLAQAVIEKI